MMKGSGFIDLDDDLKQFSGLRVDVSVAGSDRQKSLSLLPMDFCFLMDGQDAEDSTEETDEDHKLRAGIKDPRDLYRRCWRYTYRND